MIPKDLGVERLLGIMGSQKPASFGTGRKALETAVEVAVYLDRPALVIEDNEIIERKLDGVRLPKLVAEPVETEALANGERADSRPILLCIERQREAIYDAPAVDGAVQEVPAPVQELLVNPITLRRQVLANEVIVPAAGRAIVLAAMTGRRPRL